jgi:hypothetical protein
MWSGSSTPLAMHARRIGFRVNPPCKSFNFHPHFTASAARVPCRVTSLCAPQPCMYQGALLPAPLSHGQRVTSAPSHLVRKCDQHVIVGAQQRAHRRDLLNHPADQDMPRSLHSDAVACTAQVNPAGTPRSSCPHTRHSCVLGAGFTGPTTAQATLQGRASPSAWHGMHKCKDTARSFRLCLACCGSCHKLQPVPKATRRLHGQKC